MREEEEFKKNSVTGSRKRENTKNQDDSVVSNWAIKLIKKISQLQGREDYEFSSEDAGFSIPVILL